jgi:hypothetical protein
MSETTHSSATVRSLIGMLAVVCIVATIDRWVRPLPFPPKSEGLVVALPQSGGGATSQSSAADLEKAEVEAVDAYIKSPLVVVFDANSEAGFKEARIPGAIHLPPDAFPGTSRPPSIGCLEAPNSSSTARAPNARPRSTSSCG